MGGGVGLGLHRAAVVLDGGVEAAAAFEYQAGVEESLGVVRVGGECRPELLEGFVGPAAPGERATPFVACPGRRLPVRRRGLFEGGESAAEVAVSYKS